MNKFDYCTLEIIYTTFALLLLGFGAQYNRSFLSYGGSQVNIFSFVALYMLVLLLALIPYGPISTSDTSEELFRNQPSNYIFTCFIILGTLVAIVSFQSYQQKFKIGSFEYLVLTMFGSLGLIALDKASDLLLFYLSLELASFCFYILSTYKRDSSYATEAGLKYFLLGALGSGFLLFSIVLFYAIGATTNYQLLESLLLGLELSSGEVQMQRLATIFLATALLFKVASFPFHNWSLDVYEGAPISSVVFLTTVPKIGFIVALVNFLFSVGIPHYETWQFLLLASGTSSIVWGAFAGIKQKRLKRFFAISGVVNIGFLVLGVACGSLQGITSVVFYLISYVLTVFICWLLLVEESQITYRKLTLNLADVSKLGLQNSLLGICFALMMLSFAGVPPLVGFLAKFTILLPLINNSLSSLAIFLIGISLFSGFYYLRIVKIIYFEGVHDSVRGVKFYSQTSWLISYLFTLFIIMSCYPTSLLLLSTAASLGLFV